MTMILQRLTIEYQGPRRLHSKAFATAVTARGLRGPACSERGLSLCRPRAPLRRSRHLHLLRRNRCQQGGAGGREGAKWGEEQNRIIVETVF